MEMENSRSQQRAKKTKVANQRQTQRKKGKKKIELIRHSDKIEARIGAIRYWNTFYELNKVSKRERNVLAIYSELLLSALPRIGIESRFEFDKTHLDGKKKNLLQCI